MSWLLPGFLGAAFVIGLPVILHFLRSKPKAIIDFPTLRFLAEGAIRDTKKHRLRRWITLALRCLIIGLLAAAFARPFFANSHSAGGQIMIVAVDNSLGMQSRGCWETRRDWALDQLNGLGLGDQAGILMMQPAPAWLAPISGNIEQVRETLRTMQPGFEKAHYMPALRMAGQTLAAMPGHTKTILWMSDEQKAGWIGTQFDDTLPAGVRIRFADTAPLPGSQAAITSAQWSRDGFVRAIAVNIRLYEPETQTRQITVKTGGKVIAQQSVNLKTGPEQTFLVDLKSAADASTASHQGVSVSMNADDLAADDTAWLAPRDESARTVLYSPGSGPASHFLDHALGSLEQFDADPMTDQPFPQADWPAGAVAIATGDCFQPPVLDRLNRFVAAGGPIWIVVDGSEAQMAWLAQRGVHVTLRPQADEPEHLRDWDLDHPILGAFAGQSVLPLMEVEFTRSFALAGENLTPIANWPDGSAGLAELASPGGCIFLSGFPLDRSATNWPVEPSFVPFVHQTLRWLAALQKTKSDWRIGDTIPLEGRDGTWHALDSARPRPDEHIAGSVRPTVPGLYDFSDGHSHQVFAVNAPLGQSDLTPWPDPNQLTSLESKAGPDTEQAAQYAAVKLSDEAAESQQRLWWWLLAIVAIVLLAELAVANRTTV